MNLLFRITAILCWPFFAFWITWGGIKHGGNWIMPMWYKLPLLLSLFGPILVLFVINFFKTYKEKITEKIKNVNK